MYLCTRNYDLKRGGTFETAKAGTFHSVTAGTLIPLSPYKPIHMVFLCDILSHYIEYGNVWAKIKDDDNDEPIASCFEKLGNIYLDSEISVDNMLSCYPNDLICVYDCSYYEIYFKCGNRKRLLGIDTENQSKYIPFEWLIKLFNQVKKNNY